jgi:iron complex transport system permease protein
LKLKSSHIVFFGLVILLFILAFLNVRYGSVTISLKEFVDIIVGNSQDELLQTIIFSIRLPEVITAITAGAGLALSGLLLQTLFRNPLTGPSILGISSGASLGVALVILSGAVSYFGFNPWLEGLSVSIAGMLGAMSVLGVIVLIARKMTSTVALLIIGLMMGYLVSAMVSVLLYFSNQESIQSYVYWGMGSFSDVQGASLYLQSFVVLLGAAAMLFKTNVLNVLLLGNRYAQNLGVNVKREFLILIIVSGILAGVITSFCGPIAFLGMAVPHLVRSAFKSGNHTILIPGCLLIGACLALLCNLLADMPWSTLALPINAITPLFGAPVVMALIFKRKQYHS